VPMQSPMLHRTPLQVTQRCPVSISTSFDFLVLLLLLFWWLLFVLLLFGSLSFSVPIYGANPLC
jgi:hypothetical protein